MHPIPYRISPELALKHCSRKVCKKAAPKCFEVLHCHIQFEKKYAINIQNTDCWHAWPIFETLDTKKHVLTSFGKQLKIGAAAAYVIRVHEEAKKRNFSVMIFKNYELVSIRYTARKSFGYQNESIIKYQTTSNAMSLTKSGIRFLGAS